MSVSHLQPQDGSSCQSTAVPPGTVSSTSKPFLIRDNIHSIPPSNHLLSSDQPYINLTNITHLAPLMDTLTPTSLPMSVIVTSTPVTLSASASDFVPASISRNAPANPRSLLNSVPPLSVIPNSIHSNHATGILSPFPVNTSNPPDIPLFTNVSA